MGDASPIATILCPLAYERRALRRHLSDLPLRFEQCGPGMRGIARFFSQRAGSDFAEPVILAGLAGSVCDELDAGSVVAVDEVRDGRSVWRPPLQMGDVDSRSAWRSGSSETVLRTAAQRRAFAAAHSVDIVDQESVAFAQAASGAAIGWGIVRGISDDLSSILPRNIDRWIDEGGNTQWWICARDVLMHPADVARVFALQRAGARAMCGVARVIRAMLFGDKNNPGHQASQRNAFTDQLDAPVSGTHVQDAPPHDAPP